MMLNSRERVAGEAASLLYRCGQAVDDLAWDVFAACFTEDATFDLPRTGVHQGRDPMVRAVMGVRGRLRATQHMITNPIVDLEEPTIHTTCYVLAQHCREVEGAEVQYLFGGKYTDEMVIDGASLKISRRRLEILWTQGDPTVLSAG